MRIRITALPDDPRIEGVDLQHLRIGHVYDLDYQLAQLLVVLGFAVPEMRRGQRAGDALNLFADPE